MKIVVTDYFDVWGNRKDGWEVNNLSHSEYNSKINSIYDKKSLLRWLKRIGIMRKHVRTTQLIFDELDNGYEISEKKTLMPLLRVEAIL